MEDMQRVESPAPISYFYCTRNPAEPQRADPDEILRSILRQLCSSKAEQPIREPVAQIFKERKQEAEEDGSEPIKLTGRDCVEAIVSLLERNPATIIIDALDECEPSRRHKLLDALDDIILRSFNVVKIIVSSRDDNDIVCNLARSPNIYISAKDNSKDIERYVKTEVRSAIEQKRILRGEISSELESIDCLQIDRRGARDVCYSVFSEGCSWLKFYRFRWVSLQIENLCDPRRMKREGDIRHELGRLPKTLKESYDTIYEQIRGSGPFSSSTAERVLKWLLCAQRPLHSAELIEAVSVDYDCQPYQLSNNNLLDFCCNMIVLDAEMDVFRFAHLSVREYLESKDDYKDGKTHAFALERCIDVNIAASALELEQTGGNTLSIYLLCLGSVTYHSVPVPSSDFKVMWL